MCVCVHSLSGNGDEGVCTCVHSLSGNGDEGVYILRLEGHFKVHSKFDN